MPDKRYFPIDRIEHKADEVERVPLKLVKPNNLLVLPQWKMRPVPPHTPKRPLPNDGDAA